MNGSTNDPAAKKEWIKDQMNTLTTDRLLSVEGTVFEKLFAAVTYPWEVLPRINHFITELIATLDLTEFDSPREGVYIHKSATVWPSAYLAGPSIVFEGAKILHAAYIRENSLIGPHSTVSNSCEIKNSILLGHCDIPHFNYVGDSVLGLYAHLGAGVICSNLKADKTNISVRVDNKVINTGLRKFGAIIGDHAEIGCNAVLAPGSVIGKHARVYPLSFVRGVVPASSIYKKQGEIARLSQD